MEAVSSGKYHYEKDIMKIKFNSDDDLPLNKQLKFHSMTITIRSSFTTELIFMKELMLTKQV